MTSHMTCNLPKHLLPHSLHDSGLRSWTRLVCFLDLLWYYIAFHMLSINEEKTLGHPLQGWDESENIKICCPIYMPKLLNLLDRLQLQIGGIIIATSTIAS